MADSLPTHARRFSEAESSSDEVFRRLERFHGIDPNLASDRLHAIKRISGRAAMDNVIFDLTGNVYDPLTLEWLGSLTEGGSQR
jgi:hypothetical protein